MINLHKPMPYYKAAVLIKKWKAEGKAESLRMVISGTVHGIKHKDQFLNPVAARIAFICVAQRVVR